MTNIKRTYFIADIGANHDGSLTRAKDLIKLAKDAGADCAKFQHFQASKIVSAVGFNGMKSAHQRNWDKSVFEIYEDYSINPDWNHVLAETCALNEIDFMTTPYDLDTVEEINPLVKAFKIGSGDITYHALIDRIASKGKLIFLATGASTLPEVHAAVDVIKRSEAQPSLCLMQCNTNYTGSLENFKYINLNVLKTFKREYGFIPLGLSDHSYGHVAVLGAVALGARAIEKHFTDDASRKGPDHAFAMEPESWSNMVRDVRWLEAALGDGIKSVEPNEFEARVVQRRAIRVKDPLLDLTIGNLEFLRPCPEGAFTPADVGRVLHRKLVQPVEPGGAIFPADLI